MFAPGKFSASETGADLALPGIVRDALHQNPGRWTLEFFCYLLSDIGRYRAITAAGESKETAVSVSARSTISTCSSSDPARSKPGWPFWGNLSELERSTVHEQLSESVLHVLTLKPYYIQLSDPKDESVQDWEDAEKLWTDQIAQVKARGTGRAESSRSTDPPV